MSETAILSADAAALAAAEPQERTEPAWPAVFSMALGVFGLVTTEFLPASLLTKLSADLGISEGAAGQTVTATAVVAAIAAPALAIVTKRIDRRLVMWGLMTLLVLSNLLAAFAWSPVLLAARVILGIALGGFWSMSGAIAMRLVPESLLPRAMSIILTGVSVATVCAAPVGAYVGDLWGWRATFLIAAVIGAITLLVQLVTMPRLPASGVSGIRALAETAANPMIRLGLVAILLVVSGHFAAFTYMRAFLEQVTMLDIEKVSLVLLAFGIAGFFGNLAGGAVAGRNLKAAMSLAPLLMAIAAAVLFLGGASPVVAAIGVTLWGFAFGALPVSVQTWMISAAPDQAESAGGLMVTAFQVAIATGAVLGGLLVDNWSVASPVAYFVLAAFAVAVIMTARAPRRMA